MSEIMRALRLPHLRSRIIHTLAILLIFRLGVNIPLLGIDSEALSRYAESSQLLHALTLGSDAFSALGQEIDFSVQTLMLFSGGGYAKGSVFSLGLLPYIMAQSVLFLWRLFRTPFDELQYGRDEEKEQKQSTYLTVIIAVILSTIYFPLFFGTADQINHLEMATKLTIMCWLTAGAMCTLFLKRVIDEIHLVDGTLLIIMTGILFRYADSFLQLWTAEKFTVLAWSLFFLLIVTLALVFLMEAERRITVQYAKGTRTSRADRMMMVSGPSTYLPIRLLRGPRPLLGAIALAAMIETVIVFLLPYAATWAPQMNGIVNGIATNLGAIRVAMLAFFIPAYTVILNMLQFDSLGLDRRLQIDGGFIPGYRPGVRTAAYLRGVAQRLFVFSGVCQCIILLLTSAVVAYIDAPASLLDIATLMIVIEGVVYVRLTMQAIVALNSYEGFIR